jgi:hypothetical protein
MSLQNIPYHIQCSTPVHELCHGKNREDYPAMLVKELCVYSRTSSLQTCFGLYLYSDQKSICNTPKLNFIKTSNEYKNKRVGPPRDNDKGIALVLFKR